MNRPFFSLGHCNPFPSVLLISLPMLLLWRGCFYFHFFPFWCELAPSPGLLWYDSYTAGPLDISSKGRPSFLSGKRRGSSNRVYDFDDADAEGGDDDDCYAWGLE